MPGFQTTTVFTQNLGNIPSGVSTPTSAASLAAVSLEENLSLTIGKTGLVNADPAVGFDALVTAVGTAVETWVDTTLGVDITAKNVDYRAAIYSLSNFEVAVDAYSPDSANNFVVQVRVQVRIY
jgi:hypothetical protein